MQKNPDIFLKRILLRNYKELRAIAKNEDIPFQMYMKKTLTEIVASYPAELREKRKPIELERQELVRLRGIPLKSYTELNNICDNLGIDLSDLIKLETKKKAVGLPIGTRLDY